MYIKPGDNRPLRASRRLYSWFHSTPNSRVLQQVIRESPDSGVVRYLYKGNDGHLSTSKRAEAFDKIREFCRGPYQVLKEGKTKGRQRVVEGMGGAEVVTEDWWGIRFQCTE